MEVKDKTLSFMWRITKLAREPLIILDRALYGSVSMMADIQTTSLLFIAVIARLNNVRFQRVVRSKQKYRGKTIDSARRNCSSCYLVGEQAMVSGIPWYGDI